jgi:hypothetical protein
MHRTFLNATRAVGHQRTSTSPTKVTKKFNNSAILNLASNIKHVMSFASEFKLVALYNSCKSTVPIQTTLDKMGHTQPPTPVMTDNIMASGLTIGTMTPKASKSTYQ